MEQVFGNSYMCSVSPFLTEKLRKYAEIICQYQDQAGNMEKNTQKKISKQHIKEMQWERTYTTDFIFGKDASGHILNSLSPTLPADMTVFDSIYLPLYIGEERRASHCGYLRYYIYHITNLA